MTDLMDGKERLVCLHCREVYYENPLPVVSIIVSNRNREVLLVKRGKEPFLGTWCFPIGFAETKETIEEAALRELKEEAGIDGRITQLIDVSSHTNPVYGDLMIVTFEAEKVGGNEGAGDDAVDFGYFPITNLPHLAFDSQVRAIEKYKELKKDLWNIHDSFNTFVEGTLEGKSALQGGLLSDDLVAATKEQGKRIIDLWIEDVLTNPSTGAYHGLNTDELRRNAAYVVDHLDLWLRSGKDERSIRDFYDALGRKRRGEGVALEDLVSAMNLLKKHVWMFTYSFRTWDRTVDIYRMFELGERMVYFFDRAVYYLVLGYKSG